MSTTLTPAHALAMADDMAHALQHKDYAALSKARAEFSVWREAVNLQVNSMAIGAAMGNVERFRDARAKLCILLGVLE